MTPGGWFRKFRVRRVLAAAERALRLQGTAQAAAHFAKAIARAGADPDLLSEIQATAGARLLDAGAPREATAYLVAAAERAPSDTDSLFRLARAAAETNDAALEIRAWRAALVSSPDCERAHRRLAKLLYPSDPKAARPHLEAVAAAEPEWTQNWRRLARARAPDNDSDGETVAWRRVLDREPKDREAHLRLAELTWREDEPAIALEHLEAIADAPPDDNEFWERLARARAAVGDRNGEVAAWRRYLRASQYVFIAHRSIGARHLENKAPHEARIHLAAAAGLASGKKNVLEMLAKACQGLRDRGGEIDALSKLSALSPNDARVSRRLGELLSRNAQYAQAVSAFRLAARNGADDIDLRRRIARALEAAGADAPAIIGAWRAVLAFDAEDIGAHERLARHLTVCRQWAEAIPHLRKTAEANPGATEIRRVLARALDAAGDAPEQIAAWRAVLAHDEDNPDIHRRLANLLEASDPGAAQIHLEFLTTVAPENLDIWRRLARVAEATGDNETEARAQLKIINLHTEDMKAHRRLAEIYYAAGETKKTAYHLEAWVRDRDRDQAAWRKLAQIRERLNDPDGALDAWRRASALGSLDAKTNAHVGVLCHSAELYKEAIAYFQAALEIAPGDKKTMRKLARCFQAVGAPDEEIDIWRRLLKTRPDDAMAHRRLGDLHFGLKDYTQAAPHLEYASERAPKNIRLARRLAKTCRAIRDSEREITAWKRVIEENPDELIAHRRCGDLFYDMKQYADAAPHLKHAVEADPADVELLRRLVYACKKTDNAEGERLALLRLIVCEPNDDTAHRRLSALFEDSGDFERAVWHLEAAISADPADTRMRRRMAFLRRRRGDVDGEINALKTLIELEPENIKAHARCGILYYERQEYAKAAPHLRFVARGAPTNKTVRRRLIQCFQKTGAAEREAAMLEELLSLDGTDLAARRRLAALSVELGRRKASLRQLRLCVRAAPSSAADQRALAEALSASPDSRNDAAASWARLLELTPDDAEAQLRLADICLDMGRYRQAEPLLKALVARTPDNAGLWEKWARTARARRGRDGEAKVMRAAVKANRHAPAFFYRLSAYLIENGDKEGLAMMDAAWKARPDPERYADLCCKLEGSHRTDAARAGYVMLTREAPQSFAGWLGLGEMMMRMGRYRLAATYLGKAYEISGEMAHRDLWLGALIKSGAVKAAAANCLTLLENNEEDVDAQLRLAEAYEGMRRFQEAHAIVESFYRPTDALEREARLRYLAVRAQTGDAAQAADSAPAPPLVAALRKAERRQAHGDLTGAARIYREGGKPLQRLFEHVCADGVKVAGPDFLIIGAPHCRPCRIANSLKRHPQIRMLENRAQYLPAHTHYGVETYAKRFAQIEPAFCAQASEGTRKQKRLKPVFGDVSPDCLTMPDEAIELCAALYPKLRLICVVSEPASRAWSHLKHRRLAAPSENFYKSADGTLADWLSDALEGGLYERHLKRWTRWFAPAQFLIVDADRFEADPSGVLAVVSKFVGAGAFDFSSSIGGQERKPSTRDGDPPPKLVKRFLEKACKGDLYSAKALRRVLDETQSTPSARSKAA